MIIKKLNPCQYEEFESVSRLIQYPSNNIDYDSDPGDDPFWFEVACYGSGIDDLWQTDAMQQALPYLKSGQAKLAICYLREIPFGHDDHVVMQSRIACDGVDRYGIDPKQFYYFYNSDPSHLEYLNKYSLNIIQVPYFEYDFVFRHLVNNIDVCYPADALTKKAQRTFLDMNGKPNKYMRLRHVVHLWNKRLIDNGVINLLRTNEDTKHYPDKNDYYHLVKDIINEKDWKKFCEWWPQSHDNADTQQNYGKHFSGYPYNKQLYMDTHMSLISETHSGHDSCNPEFFITEKLVKAIGNCHPFVVLSTPKYLEQLKLFGYKTFEPYIDESYDQELDTELRMVKAIDSVEKLCKKGIPVDCFATAIYNQTNLFNRFHKTNEQLKGIFFNDNI